MLDLDIKKIIMGLIGGSVLVVGFVALMALFSLSAKVDKFSMLLDSELHAALQTEHLASNFKLQVQEWKNVLLRGHEAAANDKYWSRYQQLQQENQRAVSEIMAMPLPDSIKSRLQSFKNEHANIYSRYQQAHREFAQSGFDHTVGDAIVAGLDRQPIKDLEEAIVKLEVLVDDTSADVIKEKSAVIRLSVSMLVLAGIAVSLFAFWLVTVRISRPIARLRDGLMQIAGGGFLHYFA